MTPEQRFTSLLNSSAARALPQGVDSPYSNDSIARLGFIGAGIGSAFANIGAAAGGGAGAGGGAAGGGLSPITTTAATLPGGVPAVTGAGFGATTAATPLATMPAWAGGGVAAGAAGGAGAAGAGGASGAGAAGASGTPPWVGNYLMPGLNAGLGIYGANQASDAMSDASGRALAESQRQFDLFRSDQMPWITAGTNALNRLQDPAAFEASPEYAWLRTEGNRDIGNQFSAQGGAQSGNALRRLSEFQTGLAQNERDRWNSLQLNMAGLGSDASRSVGAAGSAAADRAGGYYQNQGISRASGVLGRTNALQTGLYDSYENYLTTPRRQRPRRRA